VVSGQGERFPETARVDGGDGTKGDKGEPAAMPRITRYAPKGWIYHALNRAVARLPLFQKDADYEAFERVSP